LARALSVVNIHFMRGAAGIALALPGCDLGDDALFVVDSPIQTLASQYADLGFGRVEPAGVLGRVVELQPP
jgi:hypothetical protein